MLHSSIETKLPEIIKVLKSQKVRRAYAFGSACTDKFNKDSDVFMLIALYSDEPFEGYAENFWNMEDELIALLNHPVDIVTEKQLQKPYFIKVLNRTKSPIYE